MRLSLDAVGEKRVRCPIPAGPMTQESSDKLAVKSGPLSETLGPPRTSCAPRIGQTGTNRVFPRELSQLIRRRLPDGAH